MRYRPKHTKQNKPHFSVWIMRIAATIGCLTIISAYLLSGVYAKFSTSASGSDSARVAKFEVTAYDFEGQEDASLSVDNKTATYSFKVSSNSEVSIKYDVILEFPSNVPEGVEITIDGKSASVNGSVCTISDVGTFEAGKYENSHTMQIAVSLFDEDSELNSVKVKVVASQID